MALVPSIVPKAPDHELDVAVVFKSDDRLAIALAKGSLEQAGIPFWMDPDEENFRRIFSPTMPYSCRLLVRKDYEAKARELLEPLKAPPVEEYGS